MDDDVFLSRLNKHPALRKRMEAILSVAEDVTESLDLADDAEDSLIEHGRHLNREALQAWASNKVTQAANQFEKKHKKAHIQKRENRCYFASSRLALMKKHTFIV
jgi:hypothetical protein